MDVFSRRVAEVFGRVFVLTEIFRGLLKVRAPTDEPLGGSGGMPPHKISKSRHVNISNSMECKITGIFNQNNNISDVLLTRYIYTGLVHFYVLQKLDVCCKGISG